MTRYRVDRSTAAVGMTFAAYLLGLGLFALWFWHFLQPQYTPNLGLAAYRPPPATTLSEMPARSFPHYWEALPLAETENRAEETKTTVVESASEPTIEVKKPNPPKASTRPRGRDNPMNHYAASHPRDSGHRVDGSRLNAAAYQGYSGNRPF
jgi:hypothetical protein